MKAGTGEIEPEDPGALFVSTGVASTFRETDGE
jgi:hypothetical protein